MKSSLIKLDTVSAVAIVTILLVFGIAYNSGNLFNSLGFTIYFALLFSLCKEKIE
jgi:hypothetical protein